MVKESYPATQSSIDWAAAWRERLERSGLAANLARRGIPTEEFWKRYDGWQEVLRRNGYPGKLLERIRDEIRPGDTLLDIGAGSGTFAIPLAAAARRVTTIEPSPAQVTRLRENIAAAGATNITVNENTWEKLNPADTGRYDIVLAAYCFQMPDIRSALEKMCRAAERRLVLIHTAGHDLTEFLQRELGVEPGPDYYYLVNILRQMGHAAAVEILTRRYTIPLETQLEIFRFNPGLDETQCQRLREYLQTSSKIVPRDGRPRLKRWHCDALIRVRPNET